MKKILAALLLIGSLTLSPLAVSAVTPQENLCKGSGGTWNGSSCSNPNTGGRTLESSFRDVTNILLFVIGAVSVLVIIIGGIRYVLSNGDQSAVTGAKNTILYAVIGLVVAILAYAIVEFVAGNLARGA